MGADLFLRIEPTPTTVHQGDLITYAFPVWSLGPANAVHEVLSYRAARHDVRLRENFRHAGAGDMHNSAISGNRTNHLSPKRQHGSEHHVDGAAVSVKGDGSRRHGDHRERSHPGGYDRPEPGQ